VKCSKHCVLPPSFVIHIASQAMALLVVASLVAVASAKSFLHSEVGKQSVERALLSELSGVAGTAQLQLVEAELGPMFASLPKNEHGRLDPAPVRYALHRYFMQKHGWYINGLGSVNGSDDKSSSTTIMKDRAPSYIQNLFEQRLQGQGLNQHDLAVFAATLSDLIHKEVAVSLQGVYAALELPTVGPVTEKEHDMATKAYLLTYLSGGREEVTQMSELDTVENLWREDYPAWDETLLWAADLKLASDFSLRHRLSPFVRQRRSFDKHVSFLQEFGHGLGTFQNLECHKLKNLLVEIEDEGTGRVPLSRFYRGGLEGDWTFTESVEYLRHAGALDETSPDRVSVVIPNYIQSQSNCLAGSSFYSVCCFDECEGLLGHVEEAVRGPSATPSHLAMVVSGLHSDTVHAPRNLSSALLNKLGQIAELHGGQVPLHGRLFAQWMHHAYPRECSFPHVIGASNRMSPSEWMDMHDIDSAEASEQEMASHVRTGDIDAMTPEIKREALPWTMTEELVAGHVALVEAPSTLSSRGLRVILAALVVLSMIAPMTRSWIAVSPKDTDRAARYLV